MRYQTSRTYAENRKFRAESGKLDSENLKLQRESENFEVLKVLNMKRGDWFRCTVIVTSGVGIASTLTAIGVGIFKVLQMVGILAINTPT